MFYSRIAIGSPAYRKLAESIKQFAKWHQVKVRNEIKQLLGVDSTNGIYLSSTRLITKYPPVHLIDQFTGPNTNEFYWAIRDSEINKKWVEFCKKSDLDFHRPIDIMDIDCGLIKYGGKKVFYPLGIDFYIESEVEMNESFLLSVSSEDFIMALAEYRAESIA